MKKIRYILATILIILFMNLLPLTKVSAAEEANETQSVLDIKRNEAANVKLRAEQYAIGDSVTVGGYDFIVIGNEGNKLTLLCKTVIGYADRRRAYEQAETFGSKLGGTGRLMTFAEARTLNDSDIRIGDSYWLDDWWGTNINDVNDPADIRELYYIWGGWVDRILVLFRA